MLSEYAYTTRTQAYKTHAKNRDTPANQPASRPNKQSQPACAQTAKGEFRQGRKASETLVRNPFFLHSKAHMTVPLAADRHISTGTGTGTHTSKHTRTHGCHAAAAAVRLERSVDLFLGSQGGETLSTKHGPKGVSRHFSTQAPTTAAQWQHAHTRTRTRTHARRHREEGRAFWLGHSC